MSTPSGSTPTNVASPVEPFGMSISQHVLQLNGHTVVPILLLAIGLIAHLVSVQRHAMSHTISERAWLTSLAVDRELAAA